VREDLSQFTNQYVWDYGVESQAVFYKDHSHIAPVLLQVAKGSV